MLVFHRCVPRTTSARRTFNARALTCSRFAIGALLCTLIAACGGGESAGPSDVQLEISNPSPTLAFGGSVQLSARNAKGEVAWSSSNTSVATVVSTGFVTAVGAGTATITASTATQTSNTVITVEAPPSIGLSASSASFSARAGGANPATQTINIQNAGPGTLQGIALGNAVYGSGQSGGWLSTTVSGSTATSSQHVTVQLSVNIAGLIPGEYTATLPVTATAANSPRNIVVTLTLTAPPTIELSATTAQFAAIAGGSNPASSTINITSGSSAQATGLAASVVYGVPAQGGWLSATLSSGTTPSVLTLQATTGALPVGIHTATLTITSPDAANAPRTVLVTFVVAAMPRIDVSTSAVAFAAAVGFPDPAAQQVQITNGGGGLLTALGVTVQYTGGSGWLSATLNTSTAPATLTLAATRGALTAGTYTAIVRIAAAGASNSPQEISVTFTVSAGPVIGVAPSTLTFSSTTSAAPPPQTVQITNTGDGTLTGLSTSVQYTGASGWLSHSINTTTAPAVVTVNASPTGLSPGTYSATLRIASAVATNSPVSINVTYTIAALPTIQLSATTLTFIATTGDANADPQTVSITNSGGGNLTSLSTSIAYTSGSGWLTATLNSTTAPATLTLNASHGGLAAGSYAATVSVISPGATNSPRTVAVTLVVSSPAIGLSATSRSASAGQGNGSATLQTINVSNSGTGSLTGLAASVIYDGGPSNGWLTATLSSTTAPAVLTLVTNAGTPASPRALGTYTARVRLTAPLASNSPRDITITYVVGRSLANSGIYSAISASCTGCHYAGDPENVTNLSTAAAWYTNMVGVATVRRVGYPLATTYSTRVVAGNATQSYLTYQLSHTAGAYGMPTGGPVAVGIRTLIANWINDGAHP